LKSNQNYSQRAINAIWCVLNILKVIFLKLEVFDYKVDHIEITDWFTNRLTEYAYMDQLSLIEFIEARFLCNLLRGETDFVN
jgi:hypothetical protein